jgi:hypothetical protein
MDVLIVLAVGKRLRVVIARTTRLKSPTAAVAAIKLKIPFTGALEDKTGSGKQTLRKRMNVPVTNANRLLWNRA